MRRRSPRNESSSAALRSHSSSSLGNRHLRALESSRRLPDRSARTKPIASDTSAQHAMRLAHRTDADLLAPFQIHVDRREALRIGDDARLLGPITSVGAAGCEPAKTEAMPAGPVSGV